MKLIVDNLIRTAIEKTLQELKLPKSRVSLEHPAIETYGDYSTNISLIFSPSLVFSSPRQFAEILVQSLQKNNELKDIVAKIEIAGPGFINFYLKPSVYLNELDEINKLKEKYGRSDWGKNKTWLIEHTSPNPNKAMHLGHLRNNVTGMAIANIWEYLGVKVFRDCIDNNRGIAIAKLMWGYLKFAKRDHQETVNINYWFNHQNEWKTPEESKVRPDKFVDELYVKGSTDFEENEKNQKIVGQFVIDWENKNPQNWALWKKVLDYSYQGQELTLKRLGNKWDKVWHEHNHYQKGKDLVTLGIKKGVFVKGKRGAIVTNLNKYHIPDTVVIKTDGTALYITQDLALTKLKKETFKPDKLHWVIGPEQSLALKQMFAACEQLGIVKYQDCVHIAYGYMSIKGQGKMSSRKGTVIYVDDLIDLIKKEIKTKITSVKFKSAEIEPLSEKLAIGAIKYSILKVGRLTNTAFDIKESISIDGNSGPYLQYTYARAMSVLAKSKIQNPKSETNSNIKNSKPKNFSDFENSNLRSIVSNFDIRYSNFNGEEFAILRWLYRFPEVVAEAAKQYAPNLICNFLYELAQRFNTFYNKHRIIDDKITPEIQQLRLLLTSSTAQVLKNGLFLLGIEAPPKM